MKNIAENNLIRFINITKKKDGLFANFKVKGIKGGASFSASISVDLRQQKLILPILWKKSLKSAPALPSKNSRSQNSNLKA